MPLNLRNLEFFKSLTSWTADAGTKLAEMMTSVNQGVSNIESQTNSNAQGTPQTPPAINALTVTANAGHFQVAINHDGAQFYRGVQYWVEHSATPAFTDPHAVHLGGSRNANLFLGNATRYFRAAASYGSSPPGSWVYHGGQANPRAVTGGGNIPPPNFAPSQGTGTGAAGQGLSGPGPVAYRGQGAPPIR